LPVDQPISLRSRRCLFGGFNRIEEAKKLLNAGHLQGMMNALADAH
jgi:hypothetical protein